jgi:hypothetical protein
LSVSPVGLPRAVKFALALLASASLKALALATFWYQDWQYSLPTPVPQQYEPVAFGSEVDVRGLLGDAYVGRPLAIHVVNPDCPCSRFNRDHVRTLATRYGSDVAFVALVQGSADGAALVESFADWDLPVTAVADPGGRLAARLGAYSTPQAVIVTAAGQLYYRGNYNLSRYCVDTRTEFARIALDALSARAPLPSMPPEATTAYGCPLPPRPSERGTD